MKCPNCSFQNPASARFCQDCGTTLEKKCPNCSTLNSAGANFCMNCGYNLASNLAAPTGLITAPRKILAGTSHNQSTQAADPRLVRLAAIAPNLLVEKMRASAHLAGDRRVVTALFADVVGSTALAEQLDPEDWTAIMNRAFDLFVPVIYHYEGTIARLMGDALLAFFGAPVAHEDDPHRAVRAGLNLLSTTQQYAVEVHQKYGIDFAIRVGLNTGPVVVGEVGSNLVYEYTAMGDAVNLTARMQSAARPMTVLITERTYRFVMPFFEAKDLGQITVKGKSRPVQVYEVTGLKEQPGRSRGLVGLESPMVGR